MSGVKALILNAPASNTKEKSVALDCSREDMLIAGAMTIFASKIMNCGLSKWNKMKTYIRGNVAGKFW